MGDVFDVGGGMSAFCEEAGDAGEIDDGVEIDRGLLASECAVEIAPDAGVARISGELADVVAGGT